jgi:hypothetical protein
MADMGYRQMGDAGFVAALLSVGFPALDQIGSQVASQPSGFGSGSGSGGCLCALPFESLLRLSARANLWNAVRAWAHGRAVVLAIIPADAVAESG